MKLHRSLVAAFIVASLACVVLADDPSPPAPQKAEVQDKKQPKQSDKDQPKKPAAEKQAIEPKDQAAPNIFDPAFLARSETASSYNPHMMGDFGVIFVRETFTFTGTLTTTTSVTKFNTTGGGGTTRGPVLDPVTTTTTHTTTTTTTRTLLIPVATAGAFKVAENESPRPTDRVFFTFNYYGDIQSPGAAPLPPITSSVSTTTVGTPAGGAPAPITTTTSTTSIAGLPRLTSNLYREMFGFEKTFLDGDASIEMRMPVLQLNSSINGFGSDDWGDLTIIAKYALINDRQTGDVLSLGFAVTVPTGPTIPALDGNLHSTYLQPWVGYIWNADQFFVQAFHSVVAPTDPRDITLLFNDIGINYWLYRGDSNRLLSFIVPMAEIHVTTPLNHRNPLDPVYVPDIVDLTGGVHFGIYRNTTLSIGVATPITGPRVFNVEGFVQLNWRF